MSWKEFERSLGVKRRGARSEASTPMVTPHEAEQILNRPVDDGEAAMLAWMNEQMGVAAANLPTLMKERNSSMIDSILPDFVLARLERDDGNKRPPAGAATHAWRVGASRLFTVWLRGSETLLSCIRGDVSVLKLSTYDLGGVQLTPSKIELGFVHDAERRAVLDEQAGERTLMGTITFTPSTQRLPNFGG